MKILSVEGENFLTLTKFKIYLDGKGLHLVQGVNETDSSATSNGSGKSSLVDALSWACYGQLRKIKGTDKVINRAAKKNCWVATTVQNGSSTYVITRHRKHKVHKNALRLISLQAAGEVDMTLGTDAETQKVVERVLGASFEVFMAAIYCGQEQMPDLPGMTDKQLKTLIEEAAGLQRIEAAYQVARERMNGHKNDVALQRDRALRVQGQRDHTQTQLETVQRRAAEWETTRATRVAAAERDLSVVKDMLANVARMALKLKPAVEAGKLELEGNSQWLAGHSTLQAAAEVAALAATRFEGTIKKAQLQNAAAKVKSIEGQIANVDAEMAKPCPECGKPHTEDEKTDYLKHRADALGKALLEMEALKTEVRAQLARHKTLVETADTASKAVPDVSALVARQRELTHDRASYDRVLNEVRAQQADLATAQRLLEQRQTEPNPDASALAMLQTQLAQQVSDLAAAVDAARSAEKKLQVAEAVVKVFGPAGVRAQILDTVTPFLNEKTSDYLSTLSDGAIQATWNTLTKTAAGELREAFGIEVTHSKGGDSFQLISGGEKKKVRLACGLALQDLTASRASQPIALWVGDEIDDAVDPAGLERLMTILERKARERGTVIVISHNSLGDWIDNVTTVTKFAEFQSRVEGSLCE